VTDREALDLLRLLHQYIVEFQPDIPVTIPALAEDLAMLMDVTSDEADQLRRDIEEILA